MSRARAPWLLVLALAACAFWSGGCTLFGFAAVMAEEARNQTPIDVDAEYAGLAGKNFAVVVAADRILQGQYPNLVPQLVAALTERLRSSPTGASGYQPAEVVLAYLYQNPSWVAMSRADLARALGVERLIYVDMSEFRLHDPGNQYLWQGVAMAQLGVIEAESDYPDEFMFERMISVKYPDKENFGPTDYNATEVTARLLQRFIDRTTWPFFKHEELRKMEY